MESINIVRIENKKYILSTDLLTHAPLYTKGMRSGKDLIKKKKINDKWWTYARETNGIWKKSDGKSRKCDKVFIRQCYVKEKVMELSGESIEINGVKEAPAIICLEENEMFKDDEGNLLEIETRGERIPKGVYFKVKDASYCFGMKKLYETLINKGTSNYKSDKDYKYFMCKKIINNEKKTNKDKIKKELFLTYMGMLKVLFRARNNKADRFVKWATKTLFTAQMGTKEQKTILSSKLMGTNAKSMKEAFNKNARDIPCIYLFTLGYVKDLRKSMNIDKKHADKSIVCKFGCSKEMSIRTQTHVNTYGKIDNCNLNMKAYTYIDPSNIFEAEGHVKRVAKKFGMKLKYNSEKELIVLDKENMKYMVEQYDIIGQLYMGHISEMMRKHKDLVNEIVLLKATHKADMKEKDNQLLQKDNELLKYKLEYAEKMLAISINK
jgi:hypothetical protein